MTTQLLQTKMNATANMVRVLDEGKQTKKPLPEAWAPMPSGQWLRIVRDNRIGMTHRIYRVELYDRDQKTRKAVFRRAPETLTAVRR